MDIFDIVATLEIHQYSINGTILPKEVVYQENVIKAKD